MTDAVEKMARTWASMDGKPYNEGYVEDAAFLLRRPGVGRRIEELEGKNKRLRPEGGIKPKIVAFLLGWIFIGNLDYGDGWIRAGQCDPIAELKGQDDE